MVQNSCRKGGTEGFMIVDQVKVFSQEQRLDLGGEAHRKDDVGHSPGRRNENWLPQRDKLVRAELVAGFRAWGYDPYPMAFTGELIGQVRNVEVDATGASEIVY